MNIQDRESVRQDEDFNKARSELGERIAHWIGDSEFMTTDISALSFFRHDGPTEPISYVYEPSICLVARGAKRVLLGEDIYVYDEYHYLITSVDLPVIVQVTEASKESPLLGLSLKINLKEVAQLMLDSNLPSQNVRKSQRGMAVSQVSLPMLNAIQRLIDLLDEPEGIPILAPLAQREILYRLLTGEQGPRLRELAAAGGHSQPIARAINWLRQNFNESFRVEELSSLVGMSTSSFHHHFRALTAMSPLQFQKWLRLHTARQLMLTERMDAGDAAFEVGYESPSQFSREYNRLFGAPPLRDIKRLHQIMA